MIYGYNYLLEELDFRFTKYNEQRPDDQLDWYMDIMDNLDLHDEKELKEAIEELGGFIK